MKINPLFISSLLLFSSCGGDGNDTRTSTAVTTTAVAEEKEIDENGLHQMPTGDQAHVVDRLIKAFL